MYQQLTHLVHTVDPNAQYGSLDGKASFTDATAAAEHYYDMCSMFPNATVTVYSLKPIDGIELALKHPADMSSS